MAQGVMKRDREKHYGAQSSSDALRNLFVLLDNRKISGLRYFVGALFSAEHVCLAPCALQICTSLESWHRSSISSDSYEICYWQIFWVNVSMH